MSIHNDRPGEAGGPDDRTRGGRHSAHPGRPGIAAGQAPAAAATQTINAGSRAQGRDYFDEDSGDTDPTSKGDAQFAAFQEDLGERERVKLPSNGGADLGLLILRLGLGGLFILHGAHKLFPQLGGPGPQGFAQMLQQMGFQQSSVLALVTGGIELGAGALLILGLFTAFGAAAILGEMATVVVLKLGHGFFASQGGPELEAALGVVALGLMFAGPGRAALDNGRVWYRHPVVTGFLTLLIAGGAAAGVLIGFHQGGLPALNALH